ncbi:MAG TPA: glutaredoxin family protein [Candidatus Limnocylindrales bacterium]|nr:glutaredoxin family protein [Candidatus Limnocylindrales bacterium]
MAVTLYTQDGCRFCDALRNGLRERGERFTEVNLTSNPQAVPELLKLTRGRRIVPVVVDGASMRIAPDGGSEF